MADQATNETVLRLYLVRHGEAKPKAEDPERPLTDVGRATAARVAAWAAGAGVSVDEIAHSGKRRAEQTADIFAEAIGAGQPRAVEGLGPNDDVRPIADALANEQRDVMLVGHLPFLSRMVGQLVAGDAEQTIVRFEPATLVCLSREDGQWVVSTEVSPNEVS